MNISYYTAISAMNAFQSELDVTANNMANVSTPGYKVLRSSFDDLLYTQMDTRIADQKVGHGVKTNGAETVFEQGIFEKTERDLDFAILGKAYFAVESEDEDAEEPYYTRDGSFQISATDEGNYLTTRDGHYVLSRDGDRIELEYKTVEGSNGKKQSTNELDLSGLSEVIGLYTCENPDGLIPVGKNLYGTGAVSGEWVPIDDMDENEAGSRLLSGTLELSSTYVPTEMINLLQAQRAFQLNSRIVSAADQMEEMINNLR